MTPGLAARGPPFPTKAKKDAIVAVASLEKPTVPMVVGVCEIDISSLQRVQGVKGHAVRGEHWAGDEIWAWSQGGVSGQDAPESIDSWAEEDASASPEHRMEQALIDDPEQEGDGGVLLEQQAPSQRNSHTNEHVDGEDAPPYEEVSVDDKELTTKGECFKALSISLTENSLQRSMRYSETHSYMQYTSLITQTKMIPDVDSAFRSLNRCSSQTLSYHIYLLQHQAKPHLYKSRKRAGRTRRNSSSP